MFKLCKFINELPRLKYLIESPLDNFTKNFNILTRAFHLVFYFMENLTIFVKLNFINKNYRIHIELCMGLSWLLAQIFHLTYYIKILKNTYRDEDDLRHLNVENYRVNEIYQKLKILSKIRFALILGIIKSLGDFLFACYELKVFENFLGTNFAKLLIGITGIVSSCISIYQTYFSDSYTK